MLFRSFTLVSVGLLAIAAASSSSSSSASKHVGTKIGLSSVVQYGNAFYFWDKQIQGTFQHVAATCSSLYIADADTSEDGFVNKFKGWRVCHDAEYIGINAYLQAQNDQLDGLYFNGVVSSGQKNGYNGIRRAYGSIDFVAFNNGVWQTIAGNRLAGQLDVDTERSLNTAQVAYYGDLRVDFRDGTTDLQASDYNLKAYCCVGPQADGAGHDQFEFEVVDQGDHA